MLSSFISMKQIVQNLCKSLHLFSFGNRVLFITHPQTDLLLIFSLCGVQEDIQSTPLHNEPFCVVPECSLRGGEELEEVAALSWTQKLSVLRNEALDIKCDIL